MRDDTGQSLGGTRIFVDDRLHVQIVRDRNRRKQQQQSAAQRAQGQKELFAVLRCSAQMSPQGCARDEHPHEIQEQFHSA